MYYTVLISVGVVVMGSVVAFRVYCEKTGKLDTLAAVSRRVDAAQDAFCREFAAGMGRRAPAPKPEGKRGFLRTLFRV